MSGIKFKKVDLGKKSIKVYRAVTAASHPYDYIIMRVEYSSIGKWEVIIANKNPKGEMPNDYLRSWHYDLLSEAKGNVAKAFFDEHFRETYCAKFKTIRRAA